VEEKKEMAFPYVKKYMIKVGLRKIFWCYRL